MFGGTLLLRSMQESAAWTCDLKDPDVVEGLLYNLFRLLSSVFAFNTQGGGMHRHCDSLLCVCVDVCVFN